MKRIGTHIILILLLLPAIGQAQKKDDIDALRVTVFNKVMSLSTDEAAKFWPVYNDYLQKKETLRKNHIASMKTKYANLAQLSEAEVNAMLDAEVVFKQKELDLQKEMLGKIKQILPPKKRALIFKAEQEFRKELIKIATNKDNVDN